MVGYCLTDVAVRKINENFCNTADNDDVECN